MRSCACFTRPFISQSLVDTTGSSYRKDLECMGHSVHMCTVELLLGRSYTGMCVWQRESFARIFKAIADQLDVVFIGDGYISGVERVGRITRWL
jgi:adenosylmethionine-8-amino-7-oxononanoate aminotransferase